MQRRAVMGTITQHLSEWKTGERRTSEDFDWRRCSQELRHGVDDNSCIVWAEFMTDTSLQTKLGLSTNKLFNLIATC